MTTGTTPYIDAWVIMHIQATREARRAAFAALEKGDTSTEANAAYDRAYERELARLRRERENLNE